MSVSQRTLQNTTPSPSQVSTPLPNDLLEAISIYTDKRKKPKRNRSAFILFSIDVRNKHLSEDLDELNPNDKFVKIAELWKKLSEEERKLYKEKAKKEKERYASELNDFCKIFPSEPIQRPRNHIKKPCNAYGYFLKEIKEVIRKEYPEMRMCEVLRIVGERWKTLGAAEKEKFEKKAELSRKQFKDEVSKQNLPVKKTKMEKGEVAVKVKSPQVQKEEDLVCKDSVIEELENDVFEPRLRRSTSTDNKNFLVNSRPKQEYTQTSQVDSNTALQVDALSSLLSMASCQPGMGLMLEALYWKVEGLRQQIISQISAVSSGRPVESMHFDSIPLFGQDGREKKEEF